MRKIVFCLYASYMDVYEKPVVYELGDTEADLQEGFRRLIVSNPDKAFVDRLNEKEVCILGLWDDRAGVIELLDHPKRLVHLASLFPPGFLAKKEQVNA